MAEEQLYGIEGIEHDAGHFPIPEAPPAKSEAEEHAEALETWSNNREREEASKPIVDRAYQHTDGDDVGKPYDPKGVVDVQRAAKDLSEIREAEDALREFEKSQALANEIDAARGLQPEQPAPEVLEVLEQQPQTPLVSELQQPQSAPAGTGVDPEVVRALQNPRVLSAIQQERRADIAKVDAAINAAAQWAQTNAEIAAAALLNRSELKNIPPSQLPGALAALAQSNPQVAAEIKEQIDQIGVLGQQVREAQTVAQQRAAIQFQQYGAAQDQAFDATLAGESPESVRALKEYTMNMMRGMGLGDQRLLQEWNSNLLLRSAEGQAIVADAARWRIAKAGLAQKSAKPIPNVQRPGSSVDRPDAAGRDSFALENRYRGPLSAKQAAELVIGRRARSR